MKRVVCSFLAGLGGFSLSYLLFVNAYTRWYPWTIWRDATEVATKYGLLVGLIFGVLSFAYVFTEMKKSK